MTLILWVVTIIALWLSLSLLVYGEIMIGLLLTGVSIFALYVLIVRLIETLKWKGNKYR